MEEAELLLLHSLMKNETVGSPIPTSLMGLENIQVNGFVFSIQTLYQEMAWKQTLAEARWYKSQNWNRTKQPPFALLQFPKAA